MVFGRVAVLIIKFVERESGIGGDESLIIRWGHLVETSKSVTDHKIRS